MNAGLPWENKTVETPVEPKRRGRPPKNQDTEEPLDRLEIEPEPVSLELTRVKVWASLGMTINTGNYENQKIDIGVTGLPVDAPPEYIKGQLDKAVETIHTAVEYLSQEMIRRLRDDYGR